MATRPYTFKRQVILTANGVNDITVFISAGLTYHFRHWLWNSTSTFNLIDMRLNNSIHLIDASASNPIKSTALQAVGSPNFNIRDWDADIQVDPNATLFITVADTSGAGNTIEVTLLGLMDGL